MHVTPRLLPLGEAAWTVEFGAVIDEAAHARVMALARALEAARAEGPLAGVLEWVPTFRSLTVHFDPLAADAEALGARLLELTKAPPAAGARGRRWRIPVCFGGEAGPDLEALAQASSLAPEAVVARLSAAVFRVYMLGFLPGFPYLGGLPAALARLPRLATPRKRVPARSLAVTGALCGLYPFESPGGWRLLGRTPVPLFDPRDAAAPALLAPGDEVMWQPIDAAGFARMEREATRLPRTQFLVSAEAPWP